MVKTNKVYAFNADSPVSVAQALRHENANEFMSSLDDEMERLLRMGSYDAFFGDINTIDRGNYLVVNVSSALNINPTELSISTNVGSSLEVIC